MVITGRARARVCVCVCVCMFSVCVGGSLCMFVCVRVCARARLCVCVGGGVRERVVNPLTMFVQCITNRANKANSYLPMF